MRRVFLYAEAKADKAPSGRGLREAVEEHARAL